jgi:hypothetical protein
MRFLRRFVLMLMVVGGGVLFSQAPELSQQYRQRLGGAIDELTTIIQNFDEQANHNGLDRQAALNTYGISSEKFLRSQGDAMRQSFDRYEDLTEQLAHLTAASPILRPLVVAQSPDPKTLANAWRDFVPGVPVSVAGLVWAMFGAVVGLMVSVIVIIFLQATVTVARRSSRRAPSTVTTGALR